MSNVLDPATALAAAGSASPAMARYFTLVSPILATASSASTNWARVLEQASHRQDPAAHAEAQQVALGQCLALEDTRRALAAIPVPPDLEELHRSVDRWLKATASSCEAVYQSRAPLGSRSLRRARALLRDAGVEADRFNRSRSDLLRALEQASGIGRAGAGMILSAREKAGLAVGLVLGLCMSTGVIYATVQASAPPRVAAATGQGVDAAELARIAQLLGVPVASLAGKSRAELLAMAERAGKLDQVERILGSPTERRVYPPPDVLARLRAEIARRQVAFDDPAVELVPPDRVVVTGTIEGVSAEIPVEVELKMSVTPDSRPRVDATRLEAVGVPVPTSAFDALTKRVDEANQTLPGQVPAGLVLRRLYVENGAVVAEFDRATP